MLNLLPSIISMSNSRQPQVGYRDYIGWSIWLIGFLIEVIADYQKTVFRNAPHNKVISRILFCYNTVTVYL